jgi:hypothetical protein
MKEKHSEIKVVNPENMDISVNTIIDFSQDANAGLEGTDKSSFAIPFLTLLQALSPQLKDVEGAKSGLFINTITNEIFNEIDVIPCAFQRVFIRWGSRASGGGFKGQYNSADIDLKKIEFTIDDEGAYKIGDDELVDTRNHFVLYKTKDNVWKPALISMSSTQIKKSKRWMTLIQGVEVKNSEGKPFTPPSFSHIYRVRSVEERNSKGVWNSFETSLLSSVTDAEVYAKAKSFYNSVLSCEVEVLQPTPELHVESAEKF